MSEIPNIRRALASARTATDPALQDIFVETARVIASRLRRELQDVELAIAVAEREVARARTQTIAEKRTEWPGPAMIAGATIEPEDCE